MIPRKNWRKNLNRPSKLEVWAASRPDATFYDLWDENINPVWSICLAVAGGAPRKQLTLAACAVARLCLHLVPEREARPRVAIETAEAWVRGKATAEQVSRAVDAAYAARAVNSAANAAYAAYNAANAAFDAAAHSSFAAATAASAIYTYNAATSAVYYTLRAGIENSAVLSTIRKHLVFERPPKPKGLTVWQRLAMEET